MQQQFHFLFIFELGWENVWQKNVNWLSEIKGHKYFCKNFEPHNIRLYNFLLKRSIIEKKRRLFLVKLVIQKKNLLPS